MAINHSNDHNHKILSTGKAFWIGIMLNSGFLLMEFFAGLYFNSLALLSDAGHNLTDVAGLGLSLLAIRLTKSKATERFTYGYHKSTILASLANAVILLLAVGSIGWEAIQRFSHPVFAPGKVIAIVAGIGIIINTISAYLFFKNKDRDLNVKSAYLHLAMDAVVSFGVVIAGILIFFTNQPWIDPLISIVIMIVVIYSTWSLLKESMRLSLDAVPQNVDIENIKQQLLNTKGVKDIHHIHIWAMSTTRNAMTAHLIMDNDLTESQIKKTKANLRHTLEHLNIQHATLETESEQCQEEVC
ncbi:MAG: cation transporter [Chitinophagales bacterium]|nr:cation transporter [Chitinophagales bacterium]